MTVDDSDRMSNNIPSDSEISDDEEILDSDEELQKAFSKGQLESGTYKEITPKSKVPTDEAGLLAALKSINRSDLPWIERLDLTVEPAAPVAGSTEIKEEDKVHDDFKRELYFYRLAQNAVLQGIPKLHKEGVPTRRPDDYFAQMVKSDTHMKKVREKLLSKSIAAERSEKAKKLRELKKMGKKVQNEVLKSRQKEKRETLEAVKKYRKGQQAKLDFLEGDKLNQKPKKQQHGSLKANKKREWKNKKFGFGGQKKRSKSNNKESYNDTSDYKPNRRPKSAGKNMRPGKSKRQQMKSKKR